MSHPKFYLLHGLDEFGMAEFVDGLKAGLSDDPAMALLNTTEFDGKTATLAEVRAAADAMPFLAERRLVIVDGWLTRLLGRPDDDGQADSASRGAGREAVQALAAYLPDQPETTQLVLIEPRDLPPRNPVVKAAAGQAWALVQQFDLPKGEQLIKWIQARAAAEGGQISRDAALALAQAEADPRALGHEISKLLTYANFARPVEAADVEALTPAGGQARIFDLVDSIGQRRGPPAVRELHKLLDTEEPLYVLAMIVRQFRLMLQARELLEGRASEGEVARALHLHPYVTGKICAQARNFTQAALEHIYRRLLDYDADIKTGRVEAGAALDTLVAGLTA